MKISCICTSNPAKWARVKVAGFSLSSAKDSFLFVWPILLFLEDMHIGGGGENTLFIGIRLSSFLLNSILNICICAVKYCSTQYCSWRERLSPWASLFSKRRAKYIQSFARMIEFRPLLMRLPNPKKVRKHFSHSYWRQCRTLELCQLRQSPPWRRFFLAVIHGFLCVNDW